MGKRERSVGGRREGDSLGAKRGRLARFCVEEGCYWHGGCRVVGHLGLPAPSPPLGVSLCTELRSPLPSTPPHPPVVVSRLPFALPCSFSLSLSLSLYLSLLLAHSRSSRTNVFRLARVQDILVSPLCRVTFGLYARPNLPDRRPGPPFSTNPGDELRGSRGLLVAMATEPSSPNPRRPNTGSCPSVHTSLFVSRCLFASSSNRFLRYDFSLSPRRRQGRDI